MGEGRTDDAVFIVGLEVIGGIFDVIDGSVG